MKCVFNKATLVVRVRINSFVFTVQVIVSVHTQREKLGVVVVVSSSHATQSCEFDSILGIAVVTSNKSLYPNCSSVPIAVDRELVLAGGGKRVKTSVPSIVSITWQGPGWTSSANTTPMVLWMTSVNSQPRSRENIKCTSSQCLCVAPRRSQFLRTRRCDHICGSSLFYHHCHCIHIAPAYLSVKQGPGFGWGCKGKSINPIDPAKNSGWTLGASPTLVIYCQCVPVGSQLNSKKLCQTCMRAQCASTQHPYPYGHSRV